MAKISEVLHLAADEFLWDGHPHGLGIETFSCLAAEEAWVALGGDMAQILAIEAGLQAMGCRTASSAVFDDFIHGPERQAARYSWLKFAALIAEEQGQ